MNSTHRFLAIVAAAAVVAAAPARAASHYSTAAGPLGWDGEPQQTEKFSKTLPLPQGGSLDLSNISGDIVITGGAGDQVVIDAVKRGKTAEDLEARADRGGVDRDAGRGPDAVPEGAPERQRLGRLHRERAARGGRHRADGVGQPEPGHHRRRAHGRQRERRRQS